MYLLKVRKRFLLAHTFFSLMVGVGGAALFHAFFPQWYFSAYPLIPVFFYLFGSFYIFMFELVYRRMPDKMIIVYLIAKFLKMMLSILFLLVYGLFSTGTIVPCVSVFIGYYIIYLIFETHFFFHLEEKLQKKRKEALQNEK